MDYLLAFLDEYKSRLILSVITTIIGVSPKIIAKLKKGLKCSPCFMIKTDNIDTIGISKVCEFFDNIKIDKQPQKYELTQFILWNKGKIPLSINDYSLKLRCEDSIEKIPEITVNGKILKSKSYVDDLSFFKVTTEHKDNKLKFRYKDEIAYNEGFIIYMLSKKETNDDSETPNLKMILNHKSVRQIRKTRTWLYLLIYILEILFCFVVAAVYFINKMPLPFLFTLSIITVAISAYRDVLEQSTDTIPKNLRKHLLQPNK